MKLTMTAGTARHLTYPQQDWTDDARGLSIALFAGHDATVQLERDGGVYLYYLGYTTEPFDTVAAAKQAAPAFTREVLAHLASLIHDKDPS
ncbi:hypothetical protein LGN19_35365 [Burkholderia sp. AU30198]|uniref:hypothetical protein n=1 Tax=Burkholderia sp. AU30198 TaxID=2879627 RepID=UPI001CF35069|nr:hypothetical protein [Burkholderia sp. AU30198]MCA8299072.1 hypothetical protein [Burkholderia sp. AU30198]